MHLSKAVSSSPAVRHTRWVPAAVTTWIGLMLVGCGDAVTEVPQMVDNGSWYVTGFRWPHDGDPYESANVIVFSDAASPAARRSVAELTEQALLDIKERLSLEDEALLRFPQGQDKVHVYAYKNHFPREWGGYPYHGGLLIYSLDHPERSASGETAPNVYESVVRHEIMHVVESLLLDSGHPTILEVWLKEGIAEVVSDGPPGRHIDNCAQYDALITSYGALNPIAIRLYVHYPNMDVAYNYLIPMFELAARYLFDPVGHGASLVDLRDMYVDVRQGVPFRTAFESRLGISVEQYREQFFELMAAYLP